MLKQPITLKDFQKGVAISPLLGIGSMVGCDITETPGVLKIANKLDITNSIVNTDPYITFPTVADVTVYDIVGGVEKKRRSFLTAGILNSLITTNPTNDAELAISLLGNGVDMIPVNITGTDGNEYRALVYSFNYSFEYRIGVFIFKPDGVTWEHNVVTGLSTIHAGKLYKAQDKNIYFTNGNKIGRISTITYNTGTGAITATSTLNALDLPKEDYSVTISELGINLLIGTTKAITRNTVTESANIYPWDMFSPSFRAPIQVRESGINAMVQKDNLVYFSAGREGNIYATDGASYRLIQKIPYTSSNRYNGGCYVHRNAMCTNQEGNLLVGLSTNSTGSLKSVDRLGIWEIVLNRAGYPAHLKYPYRNGDTGSDNHIISYFCVRSIDHFGVACGTQYTVTGGAAEHYVLETSRNDNQGFSPYTSYISYYESELFIVGNRKNRTSLQNINLLFARPLKSGQGIKIYYRKNIDESFTLLKTYDYTTLGAVISHEDAFQVADLEMVQFRIEMTSTAPNNLEILNISIQ